MIKRMSFLTAKEGMTYEDFVTYWRDVHAPKAARMPGLLHYSIGILDGEVPMRGATDAPIIGYGMLLFGTEEEVAAAYALNRPGFTGDHLLHFTRPYRARHVARSSWLQPRLAGCSRWAQASVGC